MRYTITHITYLLLALAGFTGHNEFLHTGLKAPILVEDCSNGLDDDDDGLVDLNDPDCICEVLSEESLIPNPSFEDITCCPTERSMLDCAVGWNQASEPTTDLIHPCGWTGWEGHIPPFPFPDGDAIMGFANGRFFNDGTSQLNWKEYAGACLTSPLKANTEYRFEFSVGFTNELLSPELDITFYGATDCGSLPFGEENPDFGCPTNSPNWKNLGFRKVGGGGGSTWVKTEISITPDEDIYAIAIGPPCKASTANRTTYYFFDNLILADLRSFEFKIAEVNHPCSPDFTLSILDREGVSYQWFKEGIALVGEESALLSTNYGEGEYQVRIESEGECLLTQSFIHTVPVFSEIDDVTICVDESYQFGDEVLTESGSYSQVFITENNCDSTVSLSLEILPELEESISAKIFEGETFEGIEDHSFDREGSYEVTLVNQFGCDSLIFLDLEFYNVYFPNVFAPNSSFENSRFTIFGNEDLIEIRSLAIYDRWGSLVYNGLNEFQNDSSGWNGRINGRIAEQGVYTYVANLELDDGLVRQFSGTVLLLR